MIAPVALEPFGPYVLVGKVGHGGMAEVFLALARGPGGFRKLLVIKRLHPHFEGDPQLVQMFLDEARLAARLHHPHVVQTNEVGSHGGRHFLAMEYLDGQPLNRVLRTSQEHDTRLPPAVATRIVSDALDGLHYAHEAQDYDGTPLHIVHRDISPHNIFVTYEGQVKLLDFGIAKAATQESATRAGLIKGKFAYIAPEQARGESVDRRADVWSMGVTLWECLAGRRLFRAATDVAILHATLHDEIPWLSDVVPEVPAELARIVDRALRRDPDGRYGTARELKDDLDEWLAAQSRASSRTTLAAMMRSLFADAIDDQRELLRACVSQVTTASGALQSLSGVLPLPREGTPVTTSAKISRAARDDEDPREGSPATWKIAAVAGAIGFAVTLAIIVPRAVSPPADAPPGARPEEPASAARDIAPEPGAVAPLARASDVPARPPSTSPPIALEPQPAPTSTPRGRGALRVPRSERATLSTAPRPPEPAPSLAPRIDPAPDADPVAPLAEGHLSLDSAPWAIVTLGDRRLGITPIEVDLAPGAHTLTLRNPEEGLETSYRVVVRSGERVSRRVALE